MHIETTGYKEGENIEVEISPNSSEFDSFEKFTVSITINNEGGGLVKNVFQGKTIIIDTEY